MKLPQIGFLALARRGGGGMRRRPRVAAGAGGLLVLVVAVLVYLLVVAGGTGTVPVLRVHRVDVYVSLPFTGPERARGLAIWRGIEAGFADNELPRGRIGAFRIHLVQRDDADTRRWSTSAVEGNALAASRDPYSVLYIGELDSGATEVSLPVLNQAGIAQITPGSGYVGLTQAVRGVTGKGEPRSFQPSGRRTLLRLIPDDMVQAGAMLDVLHKTFGCTRVAAISLGSAVDGPALVRGVRRLAKSYQLTFVATKLDRHATHVLTEYAAQLKTLDVGCFVLAGLDVPRAVRLARELREQLPHAPIIAGRGLCVPRFTDQRHGGVTAALAGGEVYCTSPILPLSQYQHAEVKEFLRAYARLFPSLGRPTPGTVYGYTAGEIASDAIAGLETSIDPRRQMLQSMLAGNLFSPVSGDVGFDSHGNSESLNYGLYRIGSAGKAEFVKSIFVIGSA